MGSPCAIDRIRSMAADNGRALRQTVSDVRRRLAALFQDGGPGPFRRVYIVGCGTSYYGAVSCKHAFEAFADIPAEGLQGFAFTAYQNPAFLGKETLVLGFSTAGTTRAICDAFAKCGKYGAYRVAITAVEDSPLARSCEAVLLTGATDETSVIRTKAQVQALLTMYLLAIELGHRKGTLTSEQVEDLLSQVDRAIDAIVELVTEREQVLRDLAYRFKDCVSANVLASGPVTGTAQCGALMITEMAKIHSWGDEMENYLHGRDRLIDEKNPLLILAPQGAASDRTLDFLTVTDHMGANTIVFTDCPTEEIRKLATYVVEMPGGFSETIAPIPYLVPLYLFGNHLAEAKGDDPNLRKHMDIVPSKVRHGEAK